MSKQFIHIKIIVELPSKPWIFSYLQIGPHFVSLSNPDSAQFVLNPEYTVEVLWGRRPIVEK